MDTGYYVTRDILHTSYKNARTMFAVGTNMSVINYYLNNWICLYYNINHVNCSPRIVCLAVFARQLFAVKLFEYDNNIVHA